MAVPSRAFVGMVVFGLIASLAIVPYTLLVLGGYQPPSAAPYWQQIFRPTFSDGDKLALVLASLFSIAVTVFAWRGLLHGARMDTRMRHQKEHERSRPPPPPPPGYQ
ncbi:MAG TPA: hypothetical protein VM327_04060 [Candidatus Thermoplasmatota archaeon]|nr:hypothetical protein [Candidatus Thermoplasmatota archaeon]